jgi:hypothetical protein
MRAPIFRGTVEKGKLVLDTRERFAALIKSLEGKRIEIVLKEKKPGQSDEQRNYYHKVVVDILADHIGYNHLEMHEALKGECNNGESTAKMSVKEFREYIDKCIRFAAIKHGVPIPEPNEVEY